MIFSDDPTSYTGQQYGSEGGGPGIREEEQPKIGYSLRVTAASNGVATGRLTHVTGTADTVVRWPLANGC